MSSSLTCQACAIDAGESGHGDFDLDWCEVCEPERWRACTPRKGGKLLHEPLLTDDTASTLAHFFTWLRPRLPPNLSLHGHHGDCTDECEYKGDAYAIPNGVVTRALEFVSEVAEWRGIPTLQFEEVPYLQWRLAKRQATLERLIELGADQGVPAIVEKQRELVKDITDELERRGNPAQERYFDYECEVCERTSTEEDEERLATYTWHSTTLCNDCAPANVISLDAARKGGE